MDNLIPNPNSPTTPKLPDLGSASVSPLGNPTSPGPHPEAVPPIQNLPSVVPEANQAPITSPTNPAAPQILNNTPTPVPQQIFNNPAPQTPIEAPAPVAAPNPTLPAPAVVSSPEVAAPNNGLETFVAPPAPTQTLPTNETPPGLVPSANEYPNPWQTPTPSPTLQTSQPQIATAPAVNVVTPKKGFLGKGLKIGGVVLLLLLLGAGGFLGLKVFVLNKVTTLDLIPDDTRFYLSLAVKDNPKAKALKDLIAKFPNGQKVSNDFEKSVFSSLSSPQNPFDDFLRLSKNELFLTQISPDETSTSPASYPIQNIISFSDMLTEQSASDRLGTINKDTDNVVKETTYNGQKIYNLHLKSAETSALPSSRLPTSTPPTIFSTVINNFIVAGPKEADLKKISDLAKIKASLGLSNQQKLKTIQQNPDHAQIAKYFPSGAFLKYYSSVPLSPYDGIFPSQNLGESALGSTPSSLATTNDGSSIAQKLTTGLALEAKADGLHITSLQIDPDQKTKNLDASNTFTFKDSLANQIPSSLQGVRPAVYAETNDLKGQVNDMVSRIKDLAENSDSKSQRETFDQASKNYDAMKTSFKQITNLDFDNDFLSWMDGQTAFIFNAGTSKVSPEILLLATIKNPSEVEDSLKKMTLPDLTSYLSGTAASYQPVHASVQKYSGVNIYTLKILSYNGFEVKFVFAVTKKKVIMDLGTNDKSVRALIDFENNPGQNLFTTSPWKDQFNGKSGKITDFSMIEPIQFYGLIDYAKSFDPSYTEAITPETEIAYKAYLKTIPSIGIVSEKKKPVIISNIFVKVAELPAAEKKAAEAAIDKLIPARELDNFSSVLGASTSNEPLGKRILEGSYGYLKGKFLP